MNRQRKTKAELRTFGLVMVVPLVLIGGYLTWKGREAAPYLLGVAGFFFLSGLFIPEILRPIEKAWMKFAEIASVVMTAVILTLTFFLIMTPYGLLLRLMGKDLLRMRFEKTTRSYWMAVESDGPGSRPDKPY